MSGNVVEIFASFQGEGLYVGAPQVFVRLGGCHFRCCYCDTPESRQPAATCRLEGREVPNPVTAAQVAGWVRDALPRPCHSISFTGGEPVLQAPFIRDVVDALGEHPPIYLDTSGSLPDKLEQVIDRVDIVALDCKLPSTPGAQVSWDDFAACVKIARRRDAFVKIVLIDAARDEEIARAASIIDRSMPVFLQPATPFAGATPPTESTVARFRNIVEAAGLPVYVMPQMHPLVGWR